jgi:hypothetical protein
VFFFHCTDLVLSALCSRHCGSSMAAEDMAMLCEVGEGVANGGVSSTSAASSPTIVLAVRNVRDTVPSACEKVRRAKNGEDRLREDQWRDAS